MRSDREQVVIVGGGVAAIEALLALHDLVGHRIGITMIAPEREFLYRPVTVAEAFERGEARAYPLEEIARYAGGRRLLTDAVSRVEADERVAVTVGGVRVAYDRLIVASGARSRPPFPGAVTFRGRADVPLLRDVLADLTSGRAGSVALTLPSEPMWALPLYEMALMTAAHLRDHGSAAEVWLVTPEEEPLELFGSAAARAIGPMLAARGIRVRTSSRPAQVRGRALLMAGAGEIYVDRVITLPVLEGPGIEGLPVDQHGFIKVDAYGRVASLENVYAAGDATAFPLKQGGLAAQQADCVAERIAADLGAAVSPKPFAPVLRGLLITGGAPLYLRSEPQRLSRPVTVAVDTPRFRYSAREATAAAGQPLWWPPAKIAGRYLAPFLATARPQPLQNELLTDRVPRQARPPSAAEYEDALGLALLLADCDARWGDYKAALNALDAAQALDGTLPPEYEAKRRAWLAAGR